MQSDICKLLEEIISGIRSTAAEVECGRAFPCELLDEIKKGYEKVSGLCERWHPISTAPKDEKVLLYEDGAYYAGTFEDGEYWSADCGQCVTMPPEPTHWMNLPSPPNQYRVSRACGCRKETTMTETNDKNACGAQRGKSVGLHDGVRRDKERNMNDVLVNIGEMIVNGNRLELPQDKHFSNYAKIKAILQKAGGKYKNCGFEFKESAQSIVDRLLGGEKIDDKKKFQFFETPLSIAERVVEMAEIEDWHRILEPSAGRGALADLFGNAPICVELNLDNCQALLSKGYQVMEGDFMKMNEGHYGLFDRIIANPPFANNQDIDHIRHMYAMLDKGGRIVSIASLSWRFGSQKKQSAFREWLVEVGAKVEELNGGEFRESGTNIKACIITIDK